MDELAVLASRIAIDPVAGLANLAAQLALDPQRSINAEELARLFRQAGAASSAASKPAVKAQGGTLGAAAAASHGDGSGSAPPSAGGGSTLTAAPAAGGGGGWAAQHAHPAPGPKHARRPAERYGAQPHRSQQGYRRHRVCRSFPRCASG